METRSSNCMILRSGTKKVAFDENVIAYISSIMRNGNEENNELNNAIEHIGIMLRSGKILNREKTDKCLRSGKVY